MSIRTPLAHVRVRTMPRIRYRFAVLLAFLLAAGLAALPAVNGTPQRADGQTANTFTIAAGTPPDSLNPFIAEYLAAFELVRASHDPLFHASAKDYTPVPGIAESYESNADGTEWTITLKEGIKFSDGEPVTAEDVVFSYQPNIDNPEEMLGYGAEFAGYKSVEAVDERTVKITTTGPMPEGRILANGMPILPKHIWEGLDPATDANDEFPWVGTGPYQVVDYEVDQFVRLEPNPHFWGGEPGADAVEIVYFSDSDAMIQALIKGDVDYVGGMTPAQFKTLQSQQDIETREGTNRRFSQLIFNPGAEDADGQPIGTGHPALQDVKVRQALHHAIDKQALVDRVHGGAATPGEGYIPPAFSQWAWTPDDETRVEFDLDRAGELLDEAGYERGDDGIRRMPNGKNPLVFELLFDSEEQSETQMSDFIQEWFAEIGIEVEKVPVSSSAFTEETSKGNYDMGFSGWSANPDPTFILSIQTCGADSGDFYCNADYDRMQTEQATEVDPQMRKQIVHEMQENLYVNAPHIILYYPKSLEAQRVDDWELMETQPQPGGVSMGQQGRWGVQSITPIGATDAAGSSNGDGSSSASVDRFGGGSIAAIVIAVIVVLGGGGVIAFVARRRKAMADDVE